MRQKFSAMFVLFVVAAALTVSGGCNGGSGSLTAPTPPPPGEPPPSPVPLTPCEALPLACEGREPFDGTTVFVPIPFTSEFLEWQIIATKPGMDGTYRRDDQVRLSARCVDKANLVKNLLVEGFVLYDDPKVFGNGTWMGFLSLIKFADFGQTTVCNSLARKGWFDLQVGTTSNGGADPKLACCSRIRDIWLRFWLNRSSAPTLTPTDLEYEQYVGWTRVN